VSIVDWTKGRSDGLPDARRAPRQAGRRARQSV